MSGWTDLPLSPTGRSQVGRLRDRLVNEPPFAAIYASPLVRALDTARPLATAGLGPLRILDELREIYCGAVEGLGVDEVERRMPELWRANLGQDDDDFRWPGGESYRELRERVMRAVEGVLGRHPGERVALVTHAGVISQVMGALARERPARWGCYRPENASITELLWRGSSGQVARFDDHAHLETSRGMHPPAG